MLFNYKKIFLSLSIIISLLTVTKLIANPATWSLIPSRFRVVWNDDPSHKASILWDSGIGLKTHNFLYYDTKDFGRNWRKYRNKVRPLKQTNFRMMNNNLVRLDGLKPNTKYYFVIRNTYGTSRKLWFQTAPDDNLAKISFITGGDSRNNRVPRQNANLLVAKLKTLFVLFGGDMTDWGTSFEWRLWFDDWQLTISKSGRVTPIIVTRGNHEESNEIHRVLFDAPELGYYSLNISKNLLKLYVLNTEVSIAGNQTSWLLTQLQSNNQYFFSTVIYHRPMRPHASSKAEGILQYEFWAKPFFKSGVDLVVESDSHTMKSTYPIIPFKGKISDEGFIRDDIKGTVYVGEGCWGAPLRAADDLKSWTRDSGSFNQFKLIFLDSSKMQIRTIMIDNAPMVGELNDDHEPFLLPENLNIYSPKTGPVITINKKINKAKL